MTNHNEIEDAVFKAISDAGIPISRLPRLVPGRWSRFSTNRDPRDTAGSVKLFPDCNAAYFQDFRSGLSGVWHVKGTEALTKEQGELNRKKIQKAREAQKRAVAMAQARAASRAASLVSIATQAADDHPYLIKKLVAAAHGLRELAAADVAEHLGWWPHCEGERLTGRLLIMPLRDFDGTISSIEFIDEWGRKSALAKGQKAGRFFAIGTLPVADSLRVILHFAEGYATAASLYRVLGGCIIVCSSVGNFVGVIAEARRRLPRARFVVCGDRETGPTSRSETRALEAAKYGSAACVFPEFGELPSPSKKDFNDMANSLGDEKTRQHIVAAVAEQSAGPDVSILDRKWEPLPTPTHLTTAGGEKLNVLGSAASCWVEDEARGRSAPVDYVFSGLITVCAGTIGMKRRVKLGRSWVEPCIIWMAIVGPPSSRKSPATDGLRPPLAAIEERLDKAYREALATYERDLIAYEEAVAAQMNAKNSGIAAGEAELKKPLKPPRPRLVINNATTEKIALMLADNPHGLLAIRDELAEMVASFDRYGKGGGDKDFWLQAYGARPYVVDRVGRSEPIKVPCAAVSIVGGIVPDRLDALLLGGDNDGFGARLPVCRHGREQTGGSLGAGRRSSNYWKDAQSAARPRMGWYGGCSGAEGRSSV